MKLTFVSFFICWMSSGLHAQTLEHIDENKYRINLPGYWKPGNKIWKILTDKLPSVCEELKEKELCGDDCNPKYTVELEMSDPLIIDYRASHLSSDYRNISWYRQTDNWEIRTVYSFESSLLLRNEKGIIVTRMILVDSTELWSIAHRVTLAAFTPAPPPRNNLFLLERRANSRNITTDPAVAYNQVASPQIIQQAGQEGETPFAYINKNKDKLVPSQRDMLTIIDGKISSW
jgi:hypothetical protein